MSKTILFIDGENFLHKIEDVLKKESKAKFSETVSIDFNKLFLNALKGLTFITNRTILLRNSEIMDAKNLMRS